MRILSHRVIISREVQAPAGDKRYHETGNQSNERGAKKELMQMSAAKLRH